MIVIINSNIMITNTNFQYKALYWTVFVQVK